MPSRRILWILAILVLLVFFVGSNIVELLVDYIWMNTMGFGQIFSTILSAKIGLGVAGFLVAFVILWANFAFALRQAGGPARILPPELAATQLGVILNERFGQRAVALLCAVISLMIAMALTAGWQKVLLFFNAVPFGLEDPVFGMDPSFYIFTMPFLDQMQSYFWSIFFISALGVGVVYFLKMQAERAGARSLVPLQNFPLRERWHVSILLSMILVGFAVEFYLNRFEELHKQGGLFTGPGYSDIYGTLPVLALVSATALVAAVGVIYSMVRGQFKVLLGVIGLVAVVWLGGNVYTSLMQRLVVTPNELEKERPFLKHHMLATNKAFGLDGIVERPLTEETELTAADIANNRPTINNVRLWDHEPLLDTFAQIQEIRTYYEFASVDNDRYMIDGELRQTMLSPRELNPQSLPSRTWVNERLTFTHGYGLTAGPVNRVNEQGLPVLFVQDLPPKSEFEELKIDSPEIYFGEIAGDYVFVNTRQKEFNYPEGEKNIFSTYDGKGGVLLDSLWRRLLFSVYLRDIKLLLSDDFTDETRVLLHRDIGTRLRNIAPFFHYDQDPYMVIFEGRLKWIFDIYTVSDRYPYSEQVGELGNYMRNPVKSVIDAKDGTVRFYSIDPDEPISTAFGKIFPGLLRPRSEMPQGMQAHIRHPPQFFNIQASIYATYHMRDVNTFYNKEDQWSVPVVGQKRMEPYFTVMKLPEEEKEEFILMLPFTPRLKDNMAAWMVARSDGEHYGQLVVYTFPKQKLIYGPKQMVARINQNPLVSQQVTLWDQSGSNVIRGTLLVIPIEKSLLYVQPLYLKAEDGRIPELKRVIVGYQNSIAMGKDLEDALEQIFGRDRSVAGSATRTTDRPGPSEPKGDLVLPGTDTPGNRALRQYRALNEAAKRGDWSRFGIELEALGRTLGEMSGKAR